MVSLRVENVKKSFRTPARSVDVLRGVSLELQAGESLAILGPSGSGKSTLLHLIGTLDNPDEGSIEINERNPFQLPEPELARFRNSQIGFVFQDHHLLPQYNVLENVLIPAIAYPSGRADARSRALDLLKRVGLENRMDHKPAELSGGESQRVAVARALINRPVLLLCDEPTGNLDEDTAARVADLLFDLHRQENNMLIAVTHNLTLAEKFHRQLHLSQGVLHRL